MKICIVSRGDLNLFPPTQGASVKLYHTLKSLSHLGHEIYFVTAENKLYYKIVDGRFKERAYPSYLAKCSALNSFREKILSFIGIPKEDAVLYHPILNFNFFLKVFYVTIKEDIDLLQPEFPAFAIPCILTRIFTGTPVCLVEHNVEYFRILKTAKKLPKKGKIVLKTLEKLVGKLSNLVIAIIDEDKKRLNRLGISSDKIKIIPHGVDLGAFKNPNGGKVREKYDLEYPTLIFHGVLCYQPNLEATKIIANRIIPSLRKKLKDFNVLVVGDFPPKNIKCPNLVFTGVVKDLSNYIDAADIAIVPLKAGGGMRMKILEYFAAKKPVISTPKGAEGIPVENGENIILADIDKFVEEVTKLMKSKKLRTRLSENAFKFVQNYDWKSISEKYLKAYKEKLKIK